MTNLEELIEAVSYAEESGTNWWEIFDSIEDAEDILTQASKEEPDEYQIAYLLNILEEDIEEIFINAPIVEFKRCIKKLKRQLRK